MENIMKLSITVNIRLFSSNYRVHLESLVCQDFLAAQE